MYDVSSQGHVNNIVLFQWTTMPWANGAVIVTQCWKLIIHFIPLLTNITCYAHVGRWNYFHISRYLPLCVVVYCTHCMCRCVVLLCMLFVSYIYKLPAGIYLYAGPVAVIVSVLSWVTNNVKIAPDLLLQFSPSFLCKNFSYVDCNESVWNLYFNKSKSYISFYHTKFKSEFLSPFWWHT
jgi:hypothetical protein